MGKLFFVRHGQTPFNIRNNEWHLAGDPISEISFQFSLQYVDPPLTPNGESQILSHKSDILSLPIDHVYVSPMLRTLQTCEILYQDHPNPPKITVMPLVTEWIHVNHDVPLYPNNNQLMFPSFDWSLMPNDYFIKSILQNKYTERLDSENYTSSLLSIMEEIFPVVIESRLELFQRTRAFKEMIKVETKEKNVLIVGHSAFYRHITCRIAESGEFEGQKLIGNGEWAEVELEGD